MTVGWLRAGFCIVRGDATTSADALQRRADALSAALDDANASRFAVRATDVATVVVGILAAYQDNREVVLLRAGVDAHQPWQIDTLVGPGDALSVATDTRSSRPNEPAIFLATSGTTGTPKLARHKLERLLGRVRAPKRTTSARWLLTYEAGSFAGLQVILTAAMGGAVLVEPSEPTIASTLTAALAHSPTHTSGTPTFWRAFLMSAGDRTSDMPLRSVTLGGEAADDATLGRLRKAWPDATLRHIYASTEAGAVFSVTDGRAGFPAAWLDKAPEGVGLRIADDELQIKSPRAMSGYAEKRNVWTDDGWLRTGDLVEHVGERVLFRGRRDARINVGGLKVLPQHVEEMLLNAPGVIDVRVWGKSNPITGQIVAADIVAIPGTEERELRRSVSKWARANLQPHEIPRQVRLVEEVGEAGSKKSRAR